ncbi:MAG: LptF/LptG family permease, partial [Pseudomonadales bacterium]|nr:LptF/LptG family permease [Pseudomonadales bacterium]
KINHMRSEGLNTGKFELGFWTKTFQPIASLSLVFVAISFIFGPLRESTMGMRVVSGLVIGILFKFVQDLLSPASLVFGFPPILATLVPILLCLAAGVLLLRRAN